jgi:hypothetical protein
VGEIEGTDRLAEAHPRVVEIEATMVDTEGGGAAALYALSGYLVGEGLVLTCAHKVVTAEKVTARLIGESGFLHAAVIWPANDTQRSAADRIDVALLWVETMTPPGSDRLVWGEYTGPEPQEVFCIGFPIAAVSGGRLHPKHVQGRLVPGEGAGRGRASLTVTSGLPVKLEKWGGLSGAMVRSENCLLGLALERQEEWVGGLDFVPTSLILAQPDLWRLLGEPELVDLGTPNLLISPAYHQLSAPTELNQITARYGKVPFVEEGPDSKLAELVDWCAEPVGAEGGVDVSVRVLTGQAGAGKTRLAAELCEKVRRERSWETGFAVDQDHGIWALAHPRKPLLIVFDYVERQSVTGRVRDLLSRLDSLGHRLGVPVRALLVSRTKGSWYARLGERAGTQFQRWLPEGSAAVVELSTSGFSRELREKHFREAYRSFAGADPEPVEVDPLLRSISGRQYKSPLLVHIAALLAAHGEPLPEPGPSGLQERLLEHLIRRERRHRWADEPALSTTKVDPAESDQAYHAVAIMTLTEPTVGEAEAFLKASPLWADQSNAARREAAKALLRLYPTAVDSGPPRHAAPIEPDLISEYLLVSQEDMGSVLTALYGLDLDSRHYARMLHILALALDHYSEAVGRFIRSIIGTLDRIADNSNDAIVKALDPSLTHLLDLAIKLYVDHGSTELAERLLVVLQRVGGDPRIAHTIAMSDLDACLEHKPLSEFGVQLYTFKVDHFRQVGAPGDLVSSLEAQIDVLWNTGRRPEAFASFREVVSLREGHGIRERAWCDWSFDKFKAFTDELNQLRAEEASTLVEQLIRLQWTAGARDIDHYRPQFEFLQHLGRRMHTWAMHHDALRIVAFTMETKQALQMTDRSDYTECVDILRVLASDFFTEGEFELAIAACMPTLHLHRQFPHFDLEHLVTLLELVKNICAFDERTALEHLGTVLEVERTMVSNAVFPATVLAEDLEAGANLLWRLGHQERALELFHEAVEERQALLTPAAKRARRDLAKALKDLATALWETGQKERALMYLRDSLRHRFTYVGNDSHLRQEAIQASDDYAAALYENGSTEKALQKLRDNELMARKAGFTTRPDPAPTPFDPSRLRIGEYRLRMTPELKTEMLALLDD